MRLKKLLPILAVLLTAMSLSTAAALAQGTDDTTVTIDVNCSELNEISVSGGQFAPVDIALNETTSTTVDYIEVEVDVGCYLEAWHVNAEITAFDNTTGLGFIPGSLFSLEAVGSDGNGLPFDPVANDTEFSGPLLGDAAGENAIFETYNIITVPPFWFFDGFVLDSPAPFVSNAWFNGHLHSLNYVLPGEYEATLTVELILDENPDTVI